jgi:hypothetical protein
VRLDGGPELSDWVLTWLSFSGLLGTALAASEIEDRRLCKLLITPRGYCARNAADSLPVAACRTDADFVFSSSLGFSISSPSPSPPTHPLTTTHLLTPIPILPHSSYHRILDTPNHSQPLPRTATNQRPTSSACPSVRLAVSLSLSLSVQRLTPDA